MKIYIRSILLLTLAGLTLPVAAGALSYKFVSVEYGKFTSAIDGFSEDFEGEDIALDFSLAVRPHVAVVAGYGAASASLTSSATNYTADISTLTFGILGHAAMSDITDFILGARFINGEADINVAGTFYQTVDRDGAVAFIGMRSMVIDRLEINGFIQKKSIEDTTHIGINFNAAYYMTKSVSLDLGYTLDADNNMLTLALSRYF